MNFLEALNDSWLTVYTSSQSISLVLWDHSFSHSEFKLEIAVSVSKRYEYTFSEIENDPLSHWLVVLVFLVTCIFNVKFDYLYRNVHETKRHLFLGRRAMTNLNSDQSLSNDQLLATP